MIYGVSLKSEGQNFPFTRKVVREVAQQGDNICDLLKT